MQCILFHWAIRNLKPLKWSYCSVEWQRMISLE